MEDRLRVSKCKLWREDSPRRTRTVAVLTSPLREPRANAELIAVGIDDGHVAQALQGLARWLRNRNFSGEKFFVPGVHIGDIQMNESADGAIAFVLGEEQRESI